MITKRVLNLFSEILSETNFLIKNNEFLIYKKQSENDPNDFVFPWKSKLKDNLAIQKKIKKESERSNRELVNFPCTLCSGKVSGIRQYFKQGRLPILILHYSGATTPKEKPFTKKNPNQIFKDKLTEDCWKGLIEKSFQFSFEEFFYEEYPACNFSHVDSKESDWKDRIEKCKIHVKENIQEFGIKAVVILGSSAKLVFGADLARENLGKKIEWDLGGMVVPVITMRSPEALVFLEERAKKSEDPNNLFQYGKDKRDLEDSFLEHLNLLKPFI
ncbi:hypothetical protein P3G55_16440 [Leptospira sp. 96542]|nr:hypothetical protein [Leptospira sp. 96542]